MATPNTFYYPQVETPDDTLTFAQGGRLMQDMPRGTNDNLMVKRAPDGNLLSWNFGGAGNHIYPYTVRVKYASTTETDMADVIDWIENICEWSKNPFVWVDEDGNERTVILTNDSYEFERHGADTVRITLLLEEVVA